MLCYFVPISLCHLNSSRFLQVIKERFAYFCVFFHWLVQFEFITAIWNVVIQQFEQFRAAELNII